jgi:Protein of unknown function (DUF742)
VTTPPGGHLYGSPQQQAPLKRFNFPSAPSSRPQPESGYLPDPGWSEPYADPTQGAYAEPMVDPYRSPVPDGYQQPTGEYRQPEAYPPPARRMPQAPTASHTPHFPSADAPLPTPRIEPHIPARPEPATRSGSLGSDHQPLVRPYAMTGGRTRPRYQLAIEALVSTTADPEHLGSQLPEHQRICHLCQEVKSVAEVSALLSIPLGVARILVADLAEAGLVAIHQPGGDEAAGGQPDVTLLERVLSGLRKL